MSEQLYFFGNTNEQRLFGVLHRPHVLDPSRPAFVFCHPLAEEKLWSHRVMVTYARRLAAAGYPVLRFDLTGHGDSSGRFEDLSLEQAAADVRSAVAEVRRATGVEAVSLLGLRLGATIAGLVAETVERLRHLVLWAPVVDGERYMQDLLRVNLMTQMAVYKEIRQERSALAAAMEAGGVVNVDGYGLTWPLFSSVSQLKLGAGARAFQGPCLIVQVDRLTKPTPDVQRLASAYAAATIEHVDEEAFWKEIATFYQDAPRLFDVTSSWLAAH